MKAIIANPPWRSTIKLSDTHVPPINTRTQYADVTNSIARKGQGRNSLAGSRGSAPWVSPINTRKLYEKVTNSIARKGQGRNSLAGSRGSAPWVPPINTRKLYEKVTNPIARKGQGRNSLVGSRGNAPWVTYSSARRRGQHRRRRRFLPFERRSARCSRSERSCQRSPRG